MDSTTFMWTNPWPHPLRGPSLPAAPSASPCPPPPTLVHTLALSTRSVAGRRRVAGRPALQRHGRAQACAQDAGRARGEASLVSPHRSSDRACRACPTPPPAAAAPTPPGPRPAHPPRCTTSADVLPTHPPARPRTRAHSDSVRRRGRLCGCAPRRADHRDAAGESAQGALLIPLPPPQRGVTPVRQHHPHSHRVLGGTAG